MHVSTKKLLYEGYQLRITTDGELLIGARNRSFDIYDMLKSNFDGDDLWDLGDDENAIEDEEGEIEGEMKILNMFLSPKT